MADRVSAHILIGGALSRKSFAELVLAIADDDPGIDWDKTPFDPENISENDPLSLMDHDVACGRFDRIEQCCRSLGLSYVRWCGSYGGSFPSVREIYPGHGEPDTFLTTDDNTLIFTIDRIRQLGSIEAVEAEYARASLNPPSLTIVDDEPADQDMMEARHG